MKYFFPIYSLGQSIFLNNMMKKGWLHENVYPQCNATLFKMFLFS